LLPAAGIVLAVACAALPSLRAAQAAPENVADRVFVEYRAGDRGAIARAMTRESAAFRSDLSARVGRWRRSPDAWQVAFLLEVGIAGFDRQWPNALALIDNAREMASYRRTSGPHPREDAIEALVHKSALAALLARSQTVAFESYYDRISKRIAPADGDAAEPGQIREPRIALIRATFLDSMNRFFVGATPTSGSRTLAVPTDVRSSERLAATEEAFRMALADPAIQHEAAVRAAFFYLRSGQIQRAMNTIRRVPPTNDGILRYWGAVVAARVLAAAGQADMAGRALEVAAALAPGTQTAPVALAALRLRQGDRDAAFAWAARARSTPDDAFDPWWVYWDGDARMLSEWLAQLRTLCLLETPP
jgi:hypothetical protein